MTLPSLVTPIFDLKLPSTKDKIKFRPFLVKEEKILLIALESGEEKDIMEAVKYIITACVINDIDIEKLPSFDIEYLFLNIRAKSVGEVIELKYRHAEEKNKKGEECKHVQDIEINIEEINVVFPKKHNRKILITNEIGIVLKYPTFTTIERTINIENDVEKTFEILLDCVESVWEDGGDKVHEDFGPEELRNFFDSMTSDQFELISQFFETMPVLSYEIKYKCEGCGEDESVVVEGLQSFFI